MKLPSSSISKFRRSLLGIPLVLLCKGLHLASDSSSLGFADQTKSLEISTPPLHRLPQVPKSARRRRRTRCYHR